MTSSRSRTSLGQSTRALLGRYLAPHRGEAILLAGLLLATTGLQLLSPQILRIFVDSALGGAELELATTAALLFFGVALLEQALAIAAAYASARLGWTTTNELREDLAEHCLALDLTFHHRTSPGELIERIDGDVQKLSGFFSTFVLQIVGSLLLLAGVLALLFWEDWRIGAALSGFTAIGLIGLFALRKTAVPYWKEARRISAELFGFLEEHLGGTEDIRACGAGDHTMNLLYGHAARRLRAERRAGLIQLRLVGMTVSLFVIGTVVSMAVSYPLYVDGVLTLGAVFMVIHYTQTIMRPLQQLTSQMEGFQIVGGSIGRLDELLHEESVLTDGPGTHVEPGPLAVELDTVRFGYHPGEAVLEEISLRVPPGRVLGLVGRTGSGKTTIARLLLRLYDPDSGVVRLDGRSLREAPLAEIRQRVGLVTQNVQLFRGTLRDNLTFFDRSIPDARVHEVLGILGLDRWIRSLDRGLDTELAGGGGGLSAGEAQLLALVRVFLRDPGVVILDEASARLDPVTEGQIESALDVLFRRRTGIIIAHRLTTIDRAHDIVVLERGRIIESGPRVELLRRPGSHFRGLLETAGMIPPAERGRS